MTVHDDTACLLGEGPLWHPERGTLYWFDILSRKLHWAGGHLSFDEHCSAAGWIDHDTLLVASQHRLFRLNLVTGAQETVVPLEGDMPATRSNDGRADPWGGFWIGTMGLQGEAGAGAIWRYYKGELRRLFAPITVSNAISFTPDGGHACFADTETHTILKVRLSDADGWPAGEPEVFVDLRAEGASPDGAVIAADGSLWSAQWGAGQVAVYDLAGRETARHPVPALQSTCPAFGGAGLSTLYVTSAAAGLSQAEILERPLSGQTFAIETGTAGQREHRVVL